MACSTTAKSDTLVSALCRLCFRLAQGGRHAGRLRQVETGDQLADPELFDLGEHRVIGLKFYPTKYFGVRLDVRDYVMVQDAVAVQRVTNNLIGTFGLFVFLPNPRPYSR